MKRLVFTVTNDLSYDQRMIRICSSLADHGFDVLLVGRRFRNSAPLKSKNYRTKRLGCLFTKRFIGYAEYNIRLFFFLLFHRFDAVCAIDLDTIIPAALVSRMRNKKRIYDAHELFCEMKEIVTRRRVYAVWKWIEKSYVPGFPLGYTVNQPIADEFRRMYGVNYQVVRNLPAPTNLVIPLKKEKYILYQGAVNEGRAFETLIPAMKQVNAKLLICGDGNFMEQAKLLVNQHNLQDRIIFKGKIEPALLQRITVEAWIGLTLFDKTGLSNYYSLANRFFDYINAGIPQVCVNYPVYRSINQEFNVAVLIDEPDSISIANGINTLLYDQEKYDVLQRHCLEARKVLNWNMEEQKLVAFYTKLFEAHAG